MKSKLITIFYFIGVFLLGALLRVVFYGVIIPNVMTGRLKALGVMTYDGKQDKFVPKSDTIIFNSAEINYLITGTTKNKK